MEKSFVQVSINDRTAEKIGFAVLAFEIFCEAEKDDLGYSFDDFIDAFMVSIITQLRLNFQDPDIFGRECLERFLGNIDSRECENFKKEEESILAVS
jgi:hypothetical protein